jgi:Tol biopolymer transport system component
MINVVKSIHTVCILVIVVTFATTVWTEGVNNETNYRTQRITTIKERTKSLDWSHTKNLITFGKWGLDGYVDVYVMQPDGSEEHCLTCDQPEVPQKHNGNPAWHPSGKYIVFTAENKNNPEELKQEAQPGRGTNCNLWVMTSDGERFYQLTDYQLRRPFKAVIHPQFSHNGKQLLWAERIERGSSFSGGWSLKIADFMVDTEGVHLENIRTLKPGEWSCFYESHAFSNDDTKILFSGNLQSGQIPVGLDIYEFDLERDHLRRVTGSDSDWDEHAHYSPDGNKIAWMSSMGFDIRWETPSDKNWQKHIVTELWLMNADGSNQQRLTYFNEPGYPEYLDGKRTIVSDSSWSPDGTSIAVLVAYEESSRLKSKIVMIEFETQNRSE